MVNIKFNYEDLLSGDAIFMEGIGHFKSPQLKELKPTSGIGNWMYTFYLNVLSWDKEDFLQYAASAAVHQVPLLEKSTQLTVFDVMTLQADFRTLLQQALSFFIVEKLEWQEKEFKFSVLDASEKSIGSICRKNFDTVRDVCLQMNYINLDKSNSDTLKHTNAKTKALWEAAQAHLKQQSKLSSGNKNYTIGNIISKLCAAGIGYTFHNIYDLTVYQLYDAFFQYGYLRAMNLNMAAFANHGGKQFDINDWLKPIKE